MKLIDNAMLSVAAYYFDNGVFDIILGFFNWLRGSSHATNILIPSVYAELAVSLNHLNALLEQDSVTNLRYGVLFLLALSSLGVYSIILAG